MSRRTTDSPTCVPGAIPDGFGGQGGNIVKKPHFQISTRQLVLTIALIAIGFPVVTWIGEHLTDSPPLSILKPGDVVTVGYGYEDYKISGTYTLKKGGRCKVVRDYGKTRDDRWDRDRNVIVKVESDGKMFFLPRSVMNPVHSSGLWWPPWLAF